MVIVDEGVENTEVRMRRKVGVVRGDLSEIVLDLSRCHHSVVPWSGNSAAMEIHQRALDDTLCRCSTRPGLQYCGNHSSVNHPFPSSLRY